MLDSDRDTYRTGLWSEMGWRNVSLAFPLILEDSLGPQCFCREHCSASHVDSVNTLIYCFSLSHVGAEFFHYSVLMDSKLHNSGFLGSE